MAVQITAAEVLGSAEDATLVVLLVRKKDGSFGLDLAGERDYEAVISALGSAAQGVVSELEKKVRDLLLTAGRAAL